MTETTSTPTSVVAGRVDRAPMLGPEHERLNAVIGRWINEGHTNVRMTLQLLDQRGFDNGMLHIHYRARYVEPPR